MYKHNLNGQEIEVQERDDWKTSIDEDFKPGDYFDEEIAWDLIEAVPPHRFSSGYFQLGEPHDHAEKDGKLRPRFLTLVKVSRDPEIWKYTGNHFSDEGDELVKLQQTTEEEY